MTDRKRNKRDKLHDRDDNYDIDVITLAPGTVFKLMASREMGTTIDTKEGKDLTVTIDKLREDILKLNEEKTKLSKSIETTAKRRKTILCNNLKGIKDSIELEKTTLQGIQYSIQRENTKLENIKDATEEKSNKLIGYKEQNVNSEREYIANMDRMRKEVNSFVLVAKNKVTNHEKQFERMQSQYKKMELDINENLKEKEKLRRMNEDFIKMDETLNRRSKMLTGMEEDLANKKQYFDAGQKEYQKRYEEREKFYADKVTEYNNNVTQLAKDQKDLAENQLSLRKEGVRLGVSDRNKKRIV